MATITSNLGLTKPAGSEAYSIDVFNNNFQKIDDSDIAAAIAAGQTNLSETLKNCTGTIAEHMKYHLSGDICIIEGRLIVNNFARTGGNPGFTFSLPNGLKAKKSFSIASCGISGTVDVPVRFGELLRIYGTANSGTITIDVTETVANMASAAKAVFTAFAVPIRVVA